jgi:hypothetical protein
MHAVCFNQPGQVESFNQPGQVETVSARRVQSLGVLAQRLVGHGRSHDVLAAVDDPYFALRDLEEDVSPQTTRAQTGARPLVTPWQSESPWRVWRVWRWPATQTFSTSSHSPRAKRRLIPRAEVVCLQPRCQQASVRQTAGELTLHPRLPSCKLRKS